MKRTLRRPSIDAYMSVAEAANLLGVTRQAIQKRIERGRLRAHKLASGNNMYLLLRDDIEQLKATRTRGGANWDRIPDGIDRR